MDWTEVKIKIATADTETAAAIANMTVPYGIYIEDYSDLEQGAMEIAHIDLIDEALLESDRTHSIIHLFLSKEVHAREYTEYLCERLRSCGIAFSIYTDERSETEWADNWKQFFKCTEIGKRLCIRPSWEPYDNREGRCVLSIDPGAAFGTGTHATTSMCLSLLEQQVKAGDTMLDIGCGSGILSIASVLLGAKHATGVDIDPVAVKVAGENAMLNGISDKTEYIVGDLNDKVHGTFDIIAANIVADVIIKLSADLLHLMKPQGLFLCSGIIDIRADEVKRALEQNGLKIIQQTTETNWVAFLATGQE